MLDKNGEQWGVCKGRDGWDTRAGQCSSKPKYRKRSSCKVNQEKCNIYTIICRKGHSKAVVAW